MTVGFDLVSPEKGHETGDAVSTQVFPPSVEVANPAPSAMSNIFGFCGLIARQPPTLVVLKPVLTEAKVAPPSEERMRPTPPDKAETKMVPC